MASKRSLSPTTNVKSKLDWKKCVICQKQKKNEKLIYPSIVDDTNDRYSNFVDDVAQYNDAADTLQKFDLTSIDNGEGPLRTLREQRGKWHKSCRNMYTKDKIERLRLKCAKSQEDDFDANTPSTSTDSGTSLRRSGRRDISSVQDTLQENRTTCLFCAEGGDTLHGISDMTVGDKIEEMANKINDTRIKTVCAMGDLVAQEIHYHLICYSKYMKMPTPDISDVDEKDIRAFTEVIIHIEDNPDITHKLSDLKKLYNDVYEEISGSPFKYNSTRLKRRILENMPNLEAYTSGREVLMTFKKNVSAMLGNNMSQTTDTETLTLWNAAKIIRKQLFTKTTATQPTSLLPSTFGKQLEATPESLLTLIQLILTGRTNINSNTARQTESLTISQLIVSNAIKTPTNKASHHKRLSPEKETPLTLYIACKIYTKTRQRQLIDTLFDLGLCTSYSRVLNLSEDIADAVTLHYENIGVVCPIILQRGRYTVTAVDNVDHNPTSTTARRSFHGTSISIFQNNHMLEDETADVPILDIGSDGDDEDMGDSVLQDFLHVNMDVPFVYRNPIGIDVNYDDNDIFQVYALKEKEWMKAVNHEIHEQARDGNVTWSAYHARAVETPASIPSTSAMLPLIDAKPNTIGTIKHVMDHVSSITTHLNPGQICVMTGDQPLYALAKQIQWTWPETYGENKFLIMMGGLHIEMEIMKALGTLLDGSGWAQCLAKADICGPGTADSFLKVSHLTRTRYAHEVTAACLWSLQDECYRDREGEDVDFARWCDIEKERSMFFFWDMILKLEATLLSFIRSIRTGNLSAYIESMKEVLPFFFALDKFNYARWLSVHLHDLLKLKQNDPNGFKELEQNFVVSKSKRQFSKVHTDQAHEWNNEAVKGTLNVISLLDSPRTLTRWMLSSGQFERMIDDFEQSLPRYRSSKDAHHADNQSTNDKFLKDVASLRDIFLESGNPFSVKESLFDLDTRYFASDQVKIDLRRLQDLGKAQHQEFVSLRLSSKQTKKVTDKIPNNKLKLMSSKTATASALQKQAQAMKDDYGLFSQLLLACQRRQIDVDDFFSHENQACPPSISDRGNIRLTTSKAQLAKCIMDDMPDAVRSINVAPTTTSLIIDAAFVVKAVKPEPNATFDEYAESFFKFILSMGARHQASRVDVIFDRYFHPSIKDVTRAKRGQSAGINIQGKSKIPRNWSNLLLNARNKERIFRFLAHKMTSKELSHHNSGGIVIVATLDGSVISSSQDELFFNSLSNCDHEEADTRMFLHAKHASMSAHKHVTIRSADTDVLVIALSVFDCLHLEQLWIASGTGSALRYIPVHDVLKELGQTRAKGLPFLHAFTGCDSVSSFWHIGKKKAWATAAENDTWQTFQFLSNSPENIPDEIFSIIQKFVILMYDKNCDKDTVNAARRKLVGQGRTVDRIPPTEKALWEHLKRAIYQAGYVWGRCLQLRLDLPSATEWGWKNDESGHEYVPLWSTQEQFGKAYRDLIRCACKKQCKKSKCSCMKKYLPCCELCKCHCLDTDTCEDLPSTSSA